MKKSMKLSKSGQGFGHFHHTAYAIASAYALMNEPDPALQWLKYAAENGYPNLPWFERDPNLDDLRKDPRFAAFLAGLAASARAFESTRCRLVTATRRCCMSRPGHVL